MVPISTMEQQEHHQSYAVVLSGFLIAFLSGGGLSFQASLNGALAVPLASSLIATLVSFAVGITTLALLFPFKLAEVKRKEGPVHTSFWVFGGIVGAYYVTSGTYLGPRLSFSLFFVCVVFGQIVASLLIDHFGIFDIPRREVTVWQFFSVCIVFAGALIAVIERFEQGDDSSIAKTILHVVVATIAGIMIAVQAPVNNAFTRRYGTRPHRTALLSFSVGGLIVLIIFSISLAFRNDLDKIDKSGLEPEYFFGGSLGAVYVISSIVLAAKVGVTLFFIAIIAGQLSASFIIDSFGLFGSEKIPISMLRVVGIVLVFLGAASYRFLPNCEREKKKTHSLG